MLGIGKEYVNWRRLCRPPFSYRQKNVSLKKHIFRANTFFSDKENHKVSNNYFSLTDSICYFYQMKSHNS